MDTMQQSHAMTAYSLADKKFNGYALMEALSYIAENPFGGNSRKCCDYSIQEFDRITENSTSAFFVVGALFIAAVFLLMALAILALKILSNLAEDKCRYKVLYHLGAGEQEQSSALFWQTFSFFILPFVFAALMSVPYYVLCRNVSFSEKGNYFSRTVTKSANNSNVVMAFKKKYNLLTKIS